MITKETFKAFLKQTSENEILDKIYESGDYIILEANIFNAGISFNLESTNFDPDRWQETTDAGNIYTDKDSFLTLLEEFNLTLNA